MKCFKDAEEIWQCLATATKNWEHNNNQHIHKGAVCYFWAVTCIEEEDLEKGILIMHQALEQDKLIRLFSNSPAYSFVMLDWNNQQYYKFKVMELEKFIANRLNSYNSYRKGKLTMSELENKFLRNTDLLHVVFRFIVEVIHIKKLLNEVNLGITENVYSSIAMAESISLLILIYFFLTF